MNINKEMKLHKWAQDMAEQKSSGPFQKKWCGMKGILVNTFQYRCRQVRLAMEESFKKESNELIPTEKVAE